jgi:putative protein kinase ArgK-like GTPase of G3E family
MAAAARPGRNRRTAAYVLGVVGPRGTGKSTLIGELALRFLAQRPPRRIAIFSHEVARSNFATLRLNTRTSKVPMLNHRVFFQTFALRSGPRALSHAARVAIDHFRHSDGFDLIIIETHDISFAGDSFGKTGAASLVDGTLFVTSPGEHIPSGKSKLLEAVDLIALNKCDDARAAAAKAELRREIARYSPHPLLHFTTATQPKDRSIDLLYAAIEDLANFESAGGERACHLEIRA